MSFNTIFYSLVKNSFYAAFRLYNGLEVKGLDNIPSGMPLIVASNHASNIDPPLIGGVFPTRLRYLAKESLFYNLFLGFFIKTLGAVPVSREDSQRAGAVMKLLLGLLQQGESILIFPEGSRSKDGKLKPLEAGVAFLSVKSGAPVLPVYIDGSSAVCPPGSSFPKTSKLRVSFAAPIFPVAANGGDRERRDLVMQSLEESLHTLEREANAHD